MEPNNSSKVTLAPEELEQLSQLFQSDSTPTTTTGGATGTPFSAGPAWAPSVPRDIPTPSSHDDAIQALKQLADSKEFMVETSKTDQFLQNIGVPTADNALQQHVDAFQRHYRDLISAYHTAAITRNSTSTNALYILNGWETTSTTKKTTQLLEETCRKAEGGYFVEWNHTGIAINPGPHFLKNLHDSGLTIKDIDCVVVTGSDQNSYADIPSLYHLNYQLNLNSSDSDLHVIHYYLNQQAHRDLSGRLKPNFKQERDTIHSLELYVDSPDTEKVKLSNTVTLTYFPTTPSNTGTLGIRLDCTGSRPEENNVSIGYVSGTAWSPALAPKLGRCDILIAGFQNTSSKDIKKLKYNDDSLGYFGSCTLAEEVSPRLLLCCEFSGIQGDIRLEVVKKIRSEYAYSGSSATTILPGDNGLSLDLSSTQILCSTSKTLVPPSQVRVIKSGDSFGSLQYLAPSCCL